MSNPCTPACEHYRFRQAVATYCAHPQFSSEATPGRTHAHGLVYLTEEIRARQIEQFPRPRGTSAPTEPPIWCPLRHDYRCPVCRAEYLDTHKTTAAAHHQQHGCGTSEPLERIQ